MIKVKMKRSYPYNGRELHEGDEVEMPDEDAKLVVDSGFAEGNIPKDDEAKKRDDEAKAVRSHVISGPEEASDRARKR